MKKQKLLKGVLREDASLLFLSGVDWPELAGVPTEADEVRITFEGGDVLVEWKETDDETE